jgi:molecular chaperone GrpE
LENKLAFTEKEVEENLAGWQRAKADFINYKRDQEKMLSELRKYANQDMIMALLPTVDSFDLATKHLPSELKDSDWAKGVMCIKGMFENFLRDAGVMPIAALGKKFDPNLFEAVGEEESDEQEDTVIEEIQKGYKMGDKVIRPAKVKVAK